MSEDWHFLSVQESLCHSEISAWVPLLCHRVWLTPTCVWPFYTGVDLSLKIQTFLDCDNSWYGVPICILVFKNEIDYLKRECSNLLQKSERRRVYKTNLKVSLSGVSLWIWKEGLIPFKKFPWTCNMIDKASSENVKMWAPCAKAIWKEVWVKGLRLVWTSDFLPSALSVAQLQHVPSVALLSKGTLKEPSLSGEDWLQPEILAHRRLTRGRALLPAWVWS